MAEPHPGADEMDQDLANVLHMTRGLGAVPLDNDHTNDIFELIVDAIDNVVQRRTGSTATAHVLLEHIDHQDTLLRWMDELAERRDEEGLELLDEEKQQALAWVAICVFRYLKRNDLFEQSHQHWAEQTANQLDAPPPAELAPESEDEFFEADGSGEEDDDDDGDDEFYDDDAEEDFPEDGTPTPTPPPDYDDVPSVDEALAGLITARRFFENDPAATPLELATVRALEQQLRTGIANS